MTIFLNLLISFVYCQKCNTNFDFSDYAYLLDQSTVYNGMQDTFEYEFSFDSKLNNQSRNEWQLNLV